MSDALAAALERMTAAWMEARGELPRVPSDPDVDPAIYVGEKNESGWIQWRPLAREPGPSLSELAPDLAPFHPSVESYFARWWFLALEGKLGDRMLSMQPNVPGYDPEEYLGLVRQYADNKEEPVSHMPIGLDNRSSLQLVVDSRSGAVWIEDWETGDLEQIAGSLDDLLDRLEF